VRTALAWRRTALVLLGLCLVGIKLSDVDGTRVAIAVAFVALVAAGVVIGYAEQGVRHLPRTGQRPVFALLLGTAAVAAGLALVGVVLVISA